LHTPVVKNGIAHLHAHQHPLVHHASSPLKRIHDIHHHAIAHAHPVPHVHWVDDHHHHHAHAHAAVVDHGDHVHTFTTNHASLVAPHIVPSVAHLDHYHHDVATYHVGNKREADLVYDNIVAPNPHHMHAHVVVNHH